MDREKRKRHSRQRRQHTVAREQPANWQRELAAKLERLENTAPGSMALLTEFDDIQKMRTGPA